MRLRMVCAAGLVVLTSGCGEVTTGARAGSPAPFGQRLGACPPEVSHTDGAAPADVMSRPGAWVRVDAIDLGGLRAPALEDTTFAGTFQVVGGDPAYVDAIGDAPPRLRMHQPVAFAVRDALALGATVSLHTGDNGDPVRVAYAVAFKDDEFAFLGRCAYGSMTEPVARRLGSGAARTLAGLVGKPSADVRAAVGAPGRTEPPPKGEVFLNPETAPRALLDTLREAMFSLSPPPASWLGGYTVCTRIRQGWSDCVDLSSVETATIPVNMYYDPKAPIVEVWLLDGRARLASPIARLHRVDVAALAARGRVEPGRRGLKLGLTLRATPSLADVLRDRGRAASAVERARVLPLV